MIVPVASRSGFAFRSRTSASSKIFSSSLSMFNPFFAAISWLWNLPPHSSTRIFICDNCSYIFFELAPSLSILLMAKTIGTPAAWAWLIASRVCGITASSAAITITAISVTLAPLALIAVKAS